MEVLTAQVYRHPHDHYRPYRSHGDLPTPKSSTGHMSFDGPDRSRHGIYDHVPASDAERVHHAHGRMPSLGHSRESSQSAGALPTLSSSKISLPPIREVLGFPSPASPPATPLASGRSMPNFASPTRDNNYNYGGGHKRQCSNLSWEQRPSAVNSPVASATTLPAIDLPPMREPSGHAPLYLGSYRTSKPPHVPARYPDPRPPYPDDRPLSPERSHPHPQPFHSRKRSYADMAMSAAYERGHTAPAWTSAQPHASQIPRTAMIPTGKPLMRTYSSSAAQMPRPDFGERRSIPPYHSVHEVRYPHDLDYYRSAGHEYQLAKARKRSNLPKESTDIMKRWFEEHIENPYPSEDEKKYFAQKAGINLTQVSNWFINHRRRCPELREQRDKKQGSERQSGEGSP